MFFIPSIVPLSFSVKDLVIKLLCLVFKLDIYVFGRLCFQGAASAGLVMACEIFPSSNRAQAGTWVQAFWGMGLVILAGFGYFLRSWRHFMLGVSVPNILGLVFIWYYIGRLRFHYDNDNEYENEIFVCWHHHFLCSSWVHIRYRCSRRQDGSDGSFISFFTKA